MISKQNRSKKPNTQHLTVETARRVFNYDPDTGLLTWAIQANSRALIGDEVGKISNRGYRVTKYKRKDYSVHRIIWLIVHGKWPTGQIDHINGEKTDNRIENLRDVSLRENLCNQKRHREGRLPGAYYDKNMRGWRAHIRINNVYVYLGMHPTEKEANAAYMKARAKL